MVISAVCVTAGSPATNSRSGHGLAHIEAAHSGPPAPSRRAGDNGRGRNAERPVFPHTRLPGGPARRRGPATAIGGQFQLRQRNREAADSASARTSTRRSWRFPRRSSRPAAGATSGERSERRPTGEASVGQAQSPAGPSRRGRPTQAQEAAQVRSPERSDHADGRPGLRRFKHCAYVQFSCGDVGNFDVWPAVRRRRSCSWAGQPLYFLRARVGEAVFGIRCSLSMARSARLTWAHVRPVDLGS